MKRGLCDQVTLQKIQKWQHLKATCSGFKKSNHKKGGDLSSKREISQIIGQSSILLHNIQFSTECRYAFDSLYLNIGVQGNRIREGVQQSPPPFQQEMCSFQKKYTLFWRKYGLKFLAKVLQAHLSAGPVHSIMYLSTHLLKETFMLKFCFDMLNGYLV